MSFDVIIPFLRPIEQLLQPKTISEIMINPDNSVWIEEEAEISRMPDLSFDDGALLTGFEVIVGKVRGVEALTILDAMNTGHRGTLATMHASSADEALRRLASLAIRSAANL